MPDDTTATGTTAGGIRRDGTVLGFDVGARRIGVAVASALGHGARALAVIDVHGHGPDWAAIDRLRCLPESVAYAICRTWERSSAELWRPRDL